MLSPKSPIPSPPLPYPFTPTSWPWSSPVLKHLKFAGPIICLSTGESQGQELGVGGVGELGEGMGDFGDSIGNVNEENT